MIKLNISSCKIKDSSKKKTKKKDENSKNMEEEIL